MPKKNELPTLAELAKKRAKNGRCILTGCNESQDKRGLCQNHYQQFYAMLEKQTDKKDYDERMVRVGQILKSGDIREINSPNPFRVEESDR
jgi:aminopeptidase C